MKKRNIIILLLACSYILFLSYCFIPVAFHHDNQIPQAIILTDRHGKVITNKPSEYGYAIRGEYDLGSRFIRDLLSIEDSDYYTHLGIDLPSKIRALRDNILGNIVTGGSTITEQYIKNKYFQGHKRSYIQKMREAQIALALTLSGNKDELLNKYLGQVYMGNNIYGVYTAMQVYFDKNQLSDLTDEEIVLLIALIHNPGAESISDKDFRAYFEKVKNRLGYKFKNTIFKLSSAPGLDVHPLVTRRYISETQSMTGMSTIDSTLQTYAREILQATLEANRYKNITNGAIYGVDPKTMEVLIYIGSKDFYSQEIDGQFDVITARRQPGSTFKPFLYLQALQSGAGINSLLIDIESQYNSFKEGRTYISENYSLKEYGLIELKKALGNSLNNASVRLAREIGLEKVFSFYQQYGFDFLYDNPQHYGYSFVLGNPSITLENLVLSYTNLLPHFVVDPNRNATFYYNEDEAILTQRYQKNTGNIDPDKFLLYDILSNPDNRGISFGVDSILNASIPQAVKTGTSSNFRDNVIVSYHPDLILGVWVGNNDNSPMKGVTGITGAGYIWHQIIEKSIELGYIENKLYPIPDGVEKKPYYLDTARLRVKNEYDKSGIEYSSRVLDNIYSFDDVYENISSEELDRLEELGISLSQNLNNEKL